MSLSAITSAASQVLPGIGFLHGRHKGAAPDAGASSGILGNTGGIPIGQLPAGASVPAVQAFMNSLVQALKQNGASAGAAAATGAAGGGYSASLLPSLQRLIGQVSSGGGAATADLSGAYQHMVNSAAGASGGAAPGASTAASGASLQQYLSGLLVSLQKSGAQTLSGAGGLVNSRI